MRDETYGTYSESTNIINNPYLSYISEYIIHNRPIPESKANTRIRMVAQVLAVGIGSIAGAPWANAARKAAGDYDWLGWLFAVGTIGAFGMGATWALLKVTTRLEPKSQQELQIEQTNKCINIFRHLLANFFGILTSLPTVYAAYKFNEQKLLALIVVCASYGFKTLGYYELLEGKKKIPVKISCRKESDEEKRFCLIQTKLVNIVDYSVTRITNMTPEEKALDTVDGNAELFLKQMANLYLHRNKRYLSKEWCGGWPRCIFQYMTLVIPVITLVVNINLSMESSTLLYDNSIFMFFYVILTDLPSFILDLIVIPTLATTIFDTIFNKIVKNETKQFVDIYYPRLSTVISLLSVILTGLAAPNRAYVVYNTLTENGRLPLTIIATIGLIMFEIFALRDVSKLFATKYANKYGTFEMKKIIRLGSQLNNLSNLLKIAHYEKIKFLITETQDRDLVSLLETLSLSNDADAVESIKFGEIKSARLIDPSSIVSDNSQLSIEDKEVPLEQEPSQDKKDLESTNLLMAASQP